MISWLRFHDLKLVQQYSEVDLARRPSLGVRPTSCHVVCATGPLGPERQRAKERANVFKKLLPRENDNRLPKVFVITSERITSERGAGRD